MPRRHFYSDLGLTKAEFYDRVRGQGWAGLDITHNSSLKAPVVIPEAGVDKQSRMWYDGNINTDKGPNAPRHAARRASSGHQGRSCARSKSGAFCGTCYEKAKGRT